MNENRRKLALSQVEIFMLKHGYSKYVRCLAQVAIDFWGRCDELAFLANANTELPNEVFQTYRELFKNEH